MGIKITKKPSTVTETKEFKHKGQTVAEHTETKPWPEISTAQMQPVNPLGLCEVGMEASYTKNMGDYNSARVQVSLKIPCPHDEINEVFEVAKGWVNERVATMVGELEGGE